MGVPLHQTRVSGMGRMDSDQKRAADILMQWRQVELSMEDPAVGQEALAILRAEADQLRDAYQRLIETEAPSGGLPNP
jgi:hypothetical protein